MQASYGYLPWLPGGGYAPQVYRSMIQTLLSANGRRHLTCARLHCATSGRLSLPLRAPAAARPTPPAAASQSQSYSFCPPSRTMRTVPATVKPRHWLYSRFQASVTLSDPREGEGVTDPRVERVIAYFMYLAT